ncbi:MAG: AlpA family transcriptional regulator [Pseudomonadota bacterium]
MAQQLQSALVILRLKQVIARVGLSRSSIYLKISLQQFPKPISLGARAVGWLESEIEEWLAHQIKQSRKAA